MQRTRFSMNPLSQLRTEMDRLFSGFMPEAQEAFWPGRNQPALNLWETEDTLHVECELPGVKGDQLDLSVIGDQLTIKIERPEMAGNGVTYHRRERPVGSFSRVLQLPLEVDADKVEAELQNGVLTLTLPKAPAARPRKINVKG